MTIEQFISMVDRKVQRRCGASVHDLPDWNFCDYFEEDFSSEEASEAAQDCASDMLCDLGFDEE
jgi:hypothetical protein